MTTSVCTDQPRVAIVIPVFKHSVLLSEAIESALCQDAEFSIKIVIVNDGCPHRETNELCKEYRAAYPGRISYLRKSNGGLSDARNFGIRFSLAKWSSLEAVYLLDADNRLRRHAIRSAMDALDRNVDASWVYPSIDMFGNYWRADYGGPYSLLVHTKINICEAGSLIRRAVFDGGVFFDTNFKQGYEDWDFFLCAAEGGHRGVHIDNFGFLYRKRPESMLANSHRDSSAIMGAMLQKHRALMSPQSRVSLEQIESPRYAIYLSDRLEYLLTVDPLAGGQTVSRADFEESYWRHRISPSRHHSPPYLLVTTSETLQQLRDAGLINWALWRAETLADEKGLVSVELRINMMRYQYAEQNAIVDDHRISDMIVLSPRMLREVLDDPKMSWINSLASDHPQPSVHKITIEAPFREVAPLAGGAIFDLLSLVHLLRSSEYRTTARTKWGWRVGGIPVREDAHRIVRDEYFFGRPAYPKAKGDKRDIGFLVPIVEFGGVEKVALNMAMSFRRQGWNTHLIVLDSNSASIPVEWQAAFDSINFLADNEFRTWSESDMGYLGTAIPEWASSGNKGASLGLLYWLDVAVNCHGGAISSIMGQLRRFGVKTALSLHLNDLTALGRASGNGYLGLAYEHAYDFILPCSKGLASWCHGMGIPDDKIVPVLNAPGFELTLDEVDRSIAVRSERRRDASLRVLFLGRLDPQKGVDKLASVMERINALNLPVEWRVVGKQIMGNQGVDSRVASVIEPPIAQPSRLADAMAWADVLLLVSLYEGLPLTILEAMRSGVVPVATDVGAIGEVVVDGVNGLLLRPHAVVEDAVSSLEKLINRDYLSTLSEAAASGQRHNTWEHATAQFVSRLSSLG